MRVLVVDDEENIRESIRRLLELEGIESAAASDGAKAAELLRSESFDAVVTDLRMPAMGGQELLELMRDEGIRCPAIMISALGEIHDAVQALKTGAVDYLIKPFDPDELVHKIKVAVSNRKMEDRVEAGSRTAAPSSRLVGGSEAARALRRSIEKIARTDATVLITGESGSGKEVVAREIHALSPRADEPFVAVNIGGIHENLMESELFGHEKGAFTGAEARKIGLFELAGSGTLFLDEIGEMPPPLQVKLLRVLQDRKIRRLGGVRDIPVGARILSATNKDVEAMVREGRFREDLYYRLNVLRVEVPPLRDRLDDVPSLADHILEKLKLRMKRSEARLGEGAVEALASYSYPGNVRELENILERALIYGEGDEIRPADLELASGGRSRREDSSEPVAEERIAAPEGPSPADPASLDSLERDAIKRALERWKGNRSRAADELGISRRTIQNKIKRYGLN
jgi:two-component system, NtrC family, response regulator AtoC